MRIVLDTNVIMSALIKDSITREIIMKSGFDFYYPKISLRELEKHKDIVLEKSELSDYEYEDLFKKLFSYISLVSTEDVKTTLEEAGREMKDIDANDVVFLAAALSIKDSIIWSDDKHFERQTKAKVLKTDEIFELIEKD